MLVPCRDDLTGKVGEGDSPLGLLPRDLRLVLGCSDDSCTSVALDPTDDRRLLGSEGRLDLPRCLVTSPPSVLVEERRPCRCRLTGETSASVVREPEPTLSLLFGRSLRLERVPCSLVLSECDDPGTMPSLFPGPYLLTLKILLKLSALVLGMGRRH